MKLHQELPAVCRLDVHLPFHQQMIFDPTADASDILDAAERCSSTLLEWFALNIRDSNARRLKYVEIPEFYVWKDGTWCARSKNRMAVGRLFSVSPNNADVVARVVKSSFRLDKPKFEFPTDPKNDGAFDESVLKFIEECDRHIEIWLNLPENEDKQFEGSEVFALVSLPASVQKRVAHNLEKIYKLSSG